MAYSTPLTFTTGMTLSGSTAASGLPQQIDGNLSVIRNCNDACIRLSLSSNQFASNNVFQSVSWTQLDGQASSAITLWSSASGTKLLAPIVGRWELLGALEWGQNSSVGYRSVAWSMNGATDYHVAAQPGSSEARLQVLPFGAIVNVTATSQFVTVKAFQNIGASAPLHGGNVDRTRCTWRLVGSTA